MLCFYVAGANITAVQPTRQIILTDWIRRHESSENIATRKYETVHLYEMWAQRTVATCLCLHEHYFMYWHSIHHVVAKNRCIKSASFELSVANFYVTAGKTNKNTSCMLEPLRVWGAVQWDDIATYLPFTEHDGMHILAFILIFRDWLGTWHSHGMSPSDWVHTHRDIRRSRRAHAITVFAKHSFHGQRRYAS